MTPIRNAVRAVCPTPGGRTTVRRRTIMAPVTLWRIVLTSWPGVTKLRSKLIVWGYRGAALRWPNHPRSTAPAPLPARQPVGLPTQRRPAVGTPPRAPAARPAGAAAPAPVGCRTVASPTGSTPASHSPTSASALPETRSPAPPGSGAAGRGSARGGGRWCWRRGRQDTAAERNGSAEMPPAWLHRQRQRRPTGTGTS